MNRRTIAALLVGEFSAREGLILALLWSDTLERSDLLTAFGAGAQPGYAARFQESLESLVERGVVVKEGSKIRLAEPSAWLGTKKVARTLAALERLRAIRGPGPAVEAEHPAVARCRAVFGDEVAGKLLGRWGLIDRDVRGHLLEAIAVCEINEFDPQDPISYLIKTARDLRRDGVPECVVKRLRGEPTAVRRPPPPPREFFSAKKVDWDPEGAVPPEKVVEEWRHIRGAIPPLESEESADA